MQYLVSVIFDNAGLATPEEMAAISAFNDRLQAEGHWVFAGGLGGPDTATVIDNRGGEPMFTDGPFVESKEYLAGFWIIEAAASSAMSRSPKRLVREATTRAHSAWCARVIVSRASTLVTGTAAPRPSDCMPSTPRRQA